MNTQLPGVPPDPYKTLSRQISRLAATARKLLDDDSIDCRTRQIKADSYIPEMVQIAASAVAALEDLGFEQEDILESIVRERTRHDAKFGEMPRKIDPLVWAAVILEELGEVVDDVGEVTT